MNYCQFRNDVIKRMAHAGGATPILPSEYQQVEYLESQNWQYIDTGIVIQNNYERVETRIMSLANGDSYRYFGYWQGGGKCSIIPYKGSGPLDKVYVGNNELTLASTATNVVYDIDLTAEGGVLTGLYCGNNINRQYTGSVQTSKSECIFSSAGGNKCYARFYYFRLYTSDGLVRDMYPCYRKSDNKPGMYDLVTGQLFTNVNTGDFIIGNPI